MQIVIPMSGFGERFRRAGYSAPKPLLEVDGACVIKHVIDLFPGEDDFVFICNRDHLKDSDYRMRERLQEYCPGGRILAIDPHKLGPVHAVSQVFGQLDDQKPTIINYCDFTCYWDYEHFKRFVKETGCGGCVPAYRGFHPHSLGSTYYAYMREQDGWLLDIQEKTPFTNTPLEEFASSGTYYFASGKLMKECFQAAVQQKLTVNNEYYVSLAYKPLLADSVPVAVYELQHFMQWGTPADFQEYLGWSATFRHLAGTPQPTPGKTGTVLMPMAGFGSRFAKEGYADPKPLIPVSGRPMATQAVHDLHPSNAQVLVVRQDLPHLQRLQAELGAAYPQARFVVLDGPTEGQAITALAGLEDSTEGPLTIAACDNGMLYAPDSLQRMLDDTDCDVLVWVARGHPEAVRNPEMYGWVEAEQDGTVCSVSVKVPLSEPSTDPIVVGTFTFKRPADFKAATKRMVERDARVNGEFYVDTLINDAVALGLRCKIFEIDHYLCWGTPNELKTFEYWQSCFDKWESHSYRLESDRRVAPDALEALRERYAPVYPQAPKPLNETNTS